MLTRLQRRINENLVPRNENEAGFDMSDGLFDSLSTDHREELMESYELVEDFFYKLPINKNYFFQKNQVEFYRFFGQNQTEEQKNKVIDLFYLIKNGITIEYIIFERMSSQESYSSAYAASTHAKNKIYLTTKFFELKLKYKAECIIHELTHIFGNTEDYCIDQTTAIHLSDKVENPTFSAGGKDIIISGSLIGNITYKNLETSRMALRKRVILLAGEFPEKAINNAYNYEFFAASILPKNCEKKTGKQKEQSALETAEEAGKREARADEPPIAVADGVKSLAEPGWPGQKESPSAAGGAKGDLEVPFALPEAPTPGSVPFVSSSFHTNSLQDNDKSDDGDISDEGEINSVVCSMDQLHISKDILKNDSLAEPVGIKQDTDWYNDTQISLLLEDICAWDGNTELLTPMLGTDWQAGNTLRDQLIQFNVRRAENIQQRKPVKDNIIVPVNLGTHNGKGKHWVLLYIKYHRNLVLPQIMYVDPFGNRIHDAILNTLKDQQLFPSVQVDTSTVHLQRDVDNCGPWVIAATQFLLAQAQQTTGISVSSLMKHLMGMDIHQIRQAHRTFLENAVDAAPLPAPFFKPHK